MSKTIKFVLIFSFFFSSLTVGSQTFEFKGYSPFGIEILNLQDTSRIAFKYMFNDMDADGDLDLYLFGIDEMDTVSTNSDLQNIRYFIEVQENIGDKWNPDFKAREKKFENFDYATGNSFFLPTIGDLNNDGMQDLVISAYADAEYIQNIRIDIQVSEQVYETHYGYEHELNSFYPGSIFIPELLDLDMDGDLDLLMSGGSKTPLNTEEDINLLLYAKNNGSASEVDFIGWYANPYGLEIDSLPSFICGGDLDLDGDMDLLGIAQVDTLQQLIYFENNPGSDDKPFFTTEDMSGFGLPITKSDEEAFYFLSPVDLDGDGDVDLILPFQHLDTIAGPDNSFTLDTVFHLFYYENVICAQEHEYRDEFLCPGDTLFVDGESYFEEGCWDIEKTAENGCVSVLHLKVEIIPEVVKEISQTGTTLEAINNDFYTYQWFDCDTEENLPGATGYQYEAEYSGNFAVLITDEYGCTAESECIYVDLTSTKSIAKKNGFVISPNPSRGSITIDVDESLEINTIELINLSGKLDKNLDPGHLQNIDLGSMERGIYFIKLITLDKQVIVRQFLLIDNIKM